LSAIDPVVVQRRSLDERHLFVVDGLFKPDLVRMLHQVLGRQAFSLSDYDTEASEHIRHWKCEFSPDALPSNPVLGAWHTSVVAKTRELFADVALDLHRVHVNSHLFGDHQGPHTDLDPGVTALYFANPEWQRDWQGEVIFFDRAGEPFHAVAPKPGRLAVFDGAILHRGGVPSRTCFAPRLSVAFKFASSPQDTLGGSRD
jgi:Rps23 Pro-64 3,4-dihydroxylase Tpa1-like proline 4-hydroxylase